MTAVHKYLLEAPEVAVPPLNDLEFDIGTKKVLWRWREIYTHIYRSEQEFRIEMQKVATQTGIDLDFTWGYAPQALRHRFCGGMISWTIESLFILMRIPYSNIYRIIPWTEKVSPARIMREAMRQDPTLDLFIRSVIMGAVEHAKVPGVESKLDVEMAEILGVL